MKPQVVIVFKGVEVKAEGNENSLGMGIAGLIARAIYMHDLDNAGTPDNLIGPELKKMLDSKYSNTPKPTHVDPRIAARPWGY